MIRTTKNCLVVLASVLLFLSCSDNDIAEDKHVVNPPTPGVASAMLSFSPDSGGVGTKLVIKGKNLGTDTSYLRVTVNDKYAPIIGVNNDVIYASVSARSDTGTVKLYVGKGDQAQVFESDKVFRYQFKRNVSTVAGQKGQAARLDGSYSSATFQRPWFVTHDKDDVIYEIDEGRGTNKNGALRKMANNEVNILVEDNTGPFQSPTVAAFNAEEDTMYMSHLYNSGNCTSRVGLICLTRAAEFVDVKPLVRMDDIEPQISGLAVNPKNGDVLFSNNADGYIYLYTPGQGKTVDQTFTRLKRVRNSSGTEMRLVFSPDGTMLYEIMKNRHCICRTPYDMKNHTLSTTLDEVFAGRWGQAGYENGIGTAARFDTPSCGEFDEDGYLYIADKYNHCIRRVSPEGEVTLWAGMPKTSGYKDGLPSEAMFNQPEGLTILTDQSIIVADRENHLIRKVVIE